MNKTSFVLDLMESGGFEDLKNLMLGIDPDSCGYEFDVSEIGDDHWSGALHFIDFCIRENSYIKDEFVMIEGKGEWLTNRSEFDLWLADGCKGLCSKGIDSYLKVKTK